MLRWLGQPPECFVPHETDLPKAPLPKAGPDRRLRWDIWAMADLLDAERRSRGLTWNQLAGELGCSSNQISGLRRRRYGINIQLAMRIAWWLRRPPQILLWQQSGKLPQRALAIASCPSWMPQLRAHDVNPGVDSLRRAASIAIESLLKINSEAGNPSTGTDFLNVDQILELCGSTLSVACKSS